MNRPGIVLALSGFHFSIERLKTANTELKNNSTPTAEANLVRAGCEALFWLFALNEDFKQLIEEKTNSTIFNWWQQKGTAGKIMNGLRLVRNRITHSYLHYWSLFDQTSGTWKSIDPPTPEKLGRPGGQHAPQQFADYQNEIESKNIVEPLESVYKVIQEEAMKYNLSNW
jgi:hypothetical protein